MAGIPYKDYDGLGLVELVKKKEIHPKELIEEAITTMNHSCGFHLHFVPIEIQPEEPLACM